LYTIVTKEPLPPIFIFTHFSASLLASIGLSDFTYEFWHGIDSWITHILPVNFLSIVCFTFILFVIPQCIHVYRIHKRTPIAIDLGAALITALFINLQLRHNFNDRIFSSQFWLIPWAVTTYFLMLRSIEKGRSTLFPFLIGVLMLLLLLA
jgi:hypothetical protein